jgi:hypothetical protein
VTTPNERTKLQTSRSGGATQQVSSTEIRATLRMHSRRGDVIVVRRFWPLWPLGYINYA